MKERMKCMFDSKRSHNEYHAYALMQQNHQNMTVLSLEVNMIVKSCLIF